ncbi:MAG: galactokinase [Lachnospiraceae bacterium]|nr:galactokinase [Lachnospiraceae bacterium]
MNITCDRLKEIYCESEESGKRYEALEKNFREIFKKECTDFFSSPGRTEIVGNHTDHNGGRVIAGSISMDTIAAVAPNEDMVINIVSEGYPDKIVIDLNRLDDEKPGNGTRPLVAGIAVGMKRQGYKLSGFDAYVSTNVIAASGVSSSASFEMLICAVIDQLFNASSMNFIEYAKAGQYAENHFWNKKSGLMDQLACAVGGVIEIDFAGEVKYEKVDFDMDGFGYSFVLVNSRGSHADLSDVYSEIPEEMFTVAEAVGGKRLCDVSAEEFTFKLPEVIDSIGNDRAVLRAIHFFSENYRVDRMSEAMKKGDTKDILSIITESGNSSWKRLQNCYVPGVKDNQSVALNLAISECLNMKLGGVCRVHGGGFMGVMLEAVPDENAQEYIDMMSRYVGRDKIYPFKIRRLGAVRV